MPEFDWDEYENKIPEFDWNQYENPKPLKATSSDKDDAFKMIKAQHPNMPEFVIRALMPLAIKGAENPVDKRKGTGTGAFLRSAIRTPLESAENLASFVLFHHGVN